MGRVASRRFGAWTRGEGRRLGYQGWWPYSPGVGRADLPSRVLGHARHERGSLLWIASRTQLETPGESNKQTFAIIVESDDRVAAGPGVPTPTVGQAPCPAAQVGRCGRGATLDASIRRGGHDGP